MSKAINLAKRGHGFVEPNPMVGCIIVNPQGEIIGRGFHEKFGEAHAEINALKEAGRKARGSTVYVTLEPCNHQGKTPPCAHALIKAGIRKVIIGAIDPHIASTGGKQTLLDAGIEVEVLEDKTCSQLIAPFKQCVTNGLPWVICKWAQTIDGCIQTPEGETNWISSNESQKLVHKKRGCVEAILVGVGTVLSDNPQLTPRNVKNPKTPLRIIIDPSLRTPLNSNVFNQEAPTLIAHDSEIDASHIPCDTIGLPSLENTLDLSHLLRHIAKIYKVTNVLAEGGVKTFEHFRDQKLINELWVFTSPKKSKMDSYTNMNAFINSMNCALVHETNSDSDTVCRYLINT